MRSMADNAKGQRKGPARSSRTSTVASVKRRERGKPVKVSITQHLGAQPLQLLEKALLRYARHHGYIRGAEPNKMRTRPKSPAA